MGWVRCVELLAIVLCAGAGLTAVGVAFAAVYKGFREAKTLRTLPATVKAPDRSTWSDAYKATVAAHWDGVRKQLKDYGADLNQIANPLRRDAIEIVKESSQWGRLGIQYALIANGGALAALPYLMSQAVAFSRIGVPDATWSAAWFTLGMTCAALCCLVAYFDFQVTASQYWANHRFELLQLSQRHFETQDPLPYESHIAMLGILQAVNVKTTLAGVALAIISWFALAYGAVRLIVSMGQ